MKLYSSNAPIALTWANRPSFTNWPRYAPIFFTDIGKSLELGDVGSMWYHDGTRWRPWGGVCSFYTLGTSNVVKNTDRTTASILASVEIPSGLIPDSQLLFKVDTIAIEKSGESDSANVQLYLGDANTSASTISTATSPTGTSNQRQDARFFRRGSTSTTAHRTYTGISSYSTTTLSFPGNSITVNNWDSASNFLSVGANLSSGTTEDITLHAFDVFIFG
jgi:hypothetical protein